MSENSYNVDKMYTYLKGYIVGANFSESMKALSYTRKKHDGQFREDGVTPYVAHPLEMACYAVALGVRDDYVIATILLHDVCEDCNIKIEDLPVCSEVKEAVRYMTIEYHGDNSQEKLLAKKLYFEKLIENKIALIVKGIDRYMNLRTMAGLFKSERIRKNIKETNELLLPVLKKGKERYPELSNILYILRQNIKGLNNVLDFYNRDEKYPYSPFPTAEENINDK